MYELIQFDNQAQNQTYGRDAFGEFGTILATDSDLAFPELSDFQIGPTTANRSPTSLHRNNRTLGQT